MKVASGIMLFLFLVSASIMVSKIEPIKGWAGTIAPYNLHEKMTRDALEGLVEAGLWRAEDIGDIPKYSNEVDQVLPHCELSCHRVTQYQRLFESYGGDVCNLFGAEWEVSYYVIMARKSYVTGDIDQFQKHLGYAIHYIQDAACPPHVFPFQEGVGNAHYDFEEYTAREYDSKNWKQVIKNAPIQAITDINDLLIKVNDTANWVNETFQPPRIGYIRQDGVPIGDLPEGWDWFMTDEDISEIMEKITSLVKGAALYACAEKTEIKWRTIYIRADGSIDPPIAPIQQNGNIYTLINNITTDSDGIVVERDNVIIDGAGYTLQGTGARGIVLDGRYNVTITNIRILSFLHGIYLSEASNNQIIQNELQENTNSGVWLTCGSSDNVISRNRIFSNYYGIAFEWSEFNSVAENEINNNTVGIVVYSSSDNNITRNKIMFNINGIVCNVQSKLNAIIGNNITANSGFGVEIENSEGHRIIENDIESNWAGIYLHESYDNMIYHNNIIYNSPHQVYIYQSTSIWDDGYPSGGNYWSDYMGKDLYNGQYQNVSDSDGLGDTPYVIDENNIDNFPLMAPFRTFSAGIWNGTVYNIDIITNSTVSNFQINIDQKMISFNVSRVEESFGFCRVTIPNIIVKDLWQGSYTVLLNGEPWPFRNWTDLENAYIYINYTHSTHEITIIPEFPSITPAIFMLATLTATIILNVKRKHQSP
jgi:parallel beta-helix repeat protein